MSKDTVKEQPVTIEEEISSIMDAAEEIEDENTEEQPIDAEDEPTDDADETGKDEDTNEKNDSESEPEDVTADEQDIDDDAESEEDTSDKLEAPEHWSAVDKEVFNKQDKEAQEFLLKRHREMEGAFTRKSQELSSKVRQFDAIEDALNPYRTEFNRSGLDDAGAVRQLASWHNALRSGGKAAVLQLAQMYNIDMSETEDQYVDPAVEPIQRELSEVKRQIAQQQQAAQREQQNQLQRLIHDFANDADETGALKHPHFESLQEDMTRLFDAKMAKDLPDAYNKALALHPELQPKPVKEVIVKQDQFKKARQAKKVATGIKSSGAVATKNRSELTLEEEIASQF